jgi:hypothetical protein
MSVLVGATNYVMGGERRVETELAGWVLRQRLESKADTFFGSTSSVLSLGPSYDSLVDPAI